MSEPSYVYRIRFLDTLKMIGVGYGIYLFYLLFQLWFINASHRYNVLLMLLSVVVSYGIFLVPIIMGIYLIYKVVNYIKNRDMEKLLGGTFSLSSTILLIVFVLTVHVLVFQYFDYNLFSRAFG